jgi:two-component system, NtrC family, response regulator HydG
MSETARAHPRVLTVLPESATAKDLVAYLERRGFDVIWAREGQSAYEILDTEAVDALIYPLRQPRIEGLRLQEVAHSRNASICAIAIATPEEIELGIEAMRQGAYDFQLLPLNLAKVGAVLERGLSYQQLVGEVSDLQRRLDERYRFNGIARRSSLWQRIYRQVEQVSQSRTSVLIRGETGTGKGEIAKAIHQQSRRRAEAFVEVNCGALPEGVVESELFGHEKGAFTGAATARKGRFELADGGTLFLDEVGDIPLPTQVKLLRVIQDGRFERVGATQTRGVDVRLIAATHRDLDSMVESGAYRADLFYRLNVITIEVPPLRECREDIPLLVNEFVRQFAADNDKPISGINSRALDVLIEYEWPGNVRELKNCIEGMVVMRSRDGKLEVDDIPRYINRRERSFPDVGFRVGMSIKEMEKIAIQETLKAVGNDRRRAAQILDIGLSTLYRKELEYALR